MEDIHLFDKEESLTPTLGGVMDGLKLAPDGDLGLDTSPQVGVGARADLDLSLSSGADSAPSGGLGRVTENREGNFDVESGRFHDPESGRFESGSPPPEWDGRGRRYRAENGQWKDRPADHFDERAEVNEDSLEPRG